MANVSALAPASDQTRFNRRGCPSLSSSHRPIHHFRPSWGRQDRPARKCFATTIQREPRLALWLRIDGRGDAPGRGRPLPGAAFFPRRGGELAMKAILSWFSVALYLFLYAPIAI